MLNFVFKQTSKIARDVLDRASGAEQPKIICQSKGPIRQILDQLPQLTEKYRPTPWLSNTHAHLLYFDLIKKRSIRLRYERTDQLRMQDGGTTAVAWLGLDLPKNTPTIVVMHTITGTPESMRELVRDLHHLTGWRIALCLRRGHANLPLTVPQINLFGSTEDLREQLVHIQQQYPTSDLYAVGSSAGTGLLVRYLGECGLDTPFKAAFALCPGYDTSSGFEYVHPFYSKMMTKKLFEKFVAPYMSVWEKTTALDKVKHAKNLLDFEQGYYEMAGYSQYRSYNEATNPIYVLENIKIPLLILNAEDDPVCHIKNLEPFKERILKMPNVAVVTTKKGSHCGFYEGIAHTESWATKLMANYLIEIQTNEI